MIMTVELFALIFATQVYRCEVDGAVTYSQTPCVGKQETVTIKPASGADGVDGNRVQFKNNTCLPSGSGRYIYNRGDFSNPTDQSLAVKATFTFRRDNVVVDVLERSFVLAPFATRSVEVMGERGDCHVTWRSSPP